MNTATKTPTTDYLRESDSANASLSELKRVLDGHHSRHRQDMLNYALVGDLSRVNRLLAEAVSALRDSSASNPKNYSLNLSDTVLRMKREIIADVKAGTIPRRVAGFSFLHDYVDANEYGGFCDDGFADRLIEYFGGRDPVHEGTPDGYVDYMNTAQNLVDEWIKRGGHNLAAFQDGAEFYDEYDGRLVARFASLVSNDFDVTGAENARAEFLRQRPNYTIIEGERA